MPLPPIAPGATWWPGKAEVKSIAGSRSERRPGSESQYPAGDGSTRARGSRPARRPWRRRCKAWSRPLRPSSSAAAARRPRIGGVGLTSSFSFLYVSRRDRARLFGLAGPPGKRLRVHRRAGTQQGIIRWRDACRQHQGVEVEIRRGAILIALHAIERQGAHVHFFPPLRPRGGAVVERVAHWATNEEGMPLQGLVGW